MVDPAEEPTQLITFDFADLLEDERFQRDQCPERPEASDSLEPPKLPSKLPPELPALDPEGPVVHLVGGLAFLDEHAKRVGLSLPELRPRT